VPLIEMTAAVLHIEAICRHPYVIAVAFGCEDYVADLRGVHCHESLLVPRSLIAMAARAAGVAPIDTVHINVHDLDDLKREAMLSRLLGFEGMLVLHPKELPIVHECFSPAPEEVRQAAEMLRLSEEAAISGKGVAWMDGRFIGPPLVRQARNILEKHRRISEPEGKERSESSAE
jgi:citrate lyase subunit beta/citryl-CoA lyase